MPSKRSGLHVPFPPRRPEVRKASLSQASQVCDAICGTLVRLTCGFVPQDLSTKMAACPLHRTGHPRSDRPNAEMSCPAHAWMPCRSAKYAQSYVRVTRLHLFAHIVRSALTVPALGAGTCPTAHACLAC